MPSLLAASRVERILITTTSVANSWGRSQAATEDFCSHRNGNNFCADPVQNCRLSRLMNKGKTVTNTERRPYQVGIP